MVDRSLLMLIVARLPSLVSVVETTFHPGVPVRLSLLLVNKRAKIIAFSAMHQRCPHGPIHSLVLGSGYQAKVEVAFWLWVAPQIKKCTILI